MAIEKNYIKKINEIKTVEKSLTSFECKFILGDSEGRPLLERDSLSDKQKALVDRIYKERVEKMSREESSIVCFGNERILATNIAGSKTYQVTVDKIQVGPAVNFSEATAIVSWISNVLASAQLVILTPCTEAQQAESSGNGFPGE